MQMKLMIRYTLLIGLVLSPIVSKVQADRTELNGTVTDRSGVVTVTQEGTNQVRSVATDGHGQFVSPPTGRFTVVFSYDGFRDSALPTLTFIEVASAQSM
jgi:hypothetical protein